MDKSLEDYIKKLLKLIDEHQLAELAIESSDFKVLLKKAEESNIIQQLPQPAISRRKSKPAARSPKPKQKEICDHYYKLCSPLVGVFYTTNTPESPPFVSPGDFINTGKVVCLVEAMKVFNEIHADRSGRLIEVCAENGEIVEAGQTLMLLDISASNPEE